MAVGTPTEGAFTGLEGADAGASTVVGAVTDVVVEVEGAVRVFVAVLVSVVDELPVGAIAVLETLV
ncbi:MAG TPA: hypothetical protein PLH57_00935 [Oligoflexia bacterium]|nr:hypothetical protein [Oligoflexia bacterium]